MRPRIPILIIIVLVVLTGITPARAGESGPTGLWASPTAPAPAEPRDKTFYGWQLIPVDMASVALIALGSDHVRDAGRPRSPARSSALAARWCSTGSG